MAFLGVLAIHFLTSLADSGRNSTSILILIIILVVLTYWGGFYGPLLDLLTAKT